MSFRQDKLILLLDSGSSQQIRQTAAKQIARIARTSFDAATSKPDAKPHVDGDSSITVHSSGAEQDAWNDTLETISKILALFKSKSSETRHAAAHAIGLLAKSMPEYIEIASMSRAFLTSQPTDLPSTLKHGQMLLASAGREYAAKPLPGDKAKRRKAMMASVGLGDAVGWGEDTDKVLDDDDDDMEDVRKTAPPSREPSVPPPDVFEGLSARQITMLKRKKGTNIMEEANKMRRLNEKAVGNGSSSAAPSRANSPPLPESSATPDLKAEVITIDPGAKVRAAEAGGQIDPALDTEGNPLASSKTLTITSGQSPWTTVLLEVIPDLHDTTWQTRHGSALVIMEILRSLGTSYANAHPELYVALSRQLLSLLVLDRFGDFVGDTVIAPVRETAAQTLGVVLKYISTPGVKEIHQTLMGMVRQPWAKRGKEAENSQKADKFAWEVRHAGLLGLKYEVAVRGDLLSTKMEEDVKPDVEMGDFNLLDDVVNAAILALGDADDDVRTVAASALTPIAETLASQLPTEELAKLLQSLWDCLAEGGDELGSSTGAVMDLLGALISYSEVIALLSADNNNLVSRVYAFLRHPIASVRLSVANILLAFSRLSSIPRRWSSDGYFSFLFQNLVLEERQDVRDVSFQAFETSLVEASDMPEGVGVVLGGDVEDWYSIIMTPIGVALDANLFRRPTKATGQTHNVDKAMMAGDMSLISMDTALQTRIAGAKALALLRRYKLTEINDIKLLRQFLGSASSHQTFLASVIIQEWALDTESRVSDPFSFSLGTSNPDVESLSTLLIDRIGSPAPSTYHEMAMVLQRIYSECSALLTAFSVEGKLSKDKVPSLPKRIDPLSNTPDVFSIESAHHAVTTQFDILAGKLSKNAIKNALPSLQDRRNKVMGSVGYFSIMKEKYDVQVMAGIAGALVALKIMPPKFGPVIKNLMDGVKKEENEILQKRDAFWVAAFIQYTTSPFFTGRINPSDKVVKNLFTFLCLDTSVTPVFSPTAQGATEGIITLLEERTAAAAANARKKDIVEESEEQMASRMTRRGALETFKAMAKRFGSNLFEKVPKFWEGVSGALLANFADGVNMEQVDQNLTANVQAGQDLIDALTSLRLIAPELDPVLYYKLHDLFSPTITALQSSFSVVRNAAAQCLAAMCDVMTDEGMKRVVDDVVPLVGDAKKAYSRQGAVEAIHRIIKVLDLKALPYVLFLIVPILGRMSDPDEHVRLLSTSTFASLVKMVPLEAGIPDPPGFSADLLAKRDEERKFLMQLLDGSKAEQYQIPVEIKAELRQYQKDGVSWLAFLAKYQLHGILCDDMGLGKSLQSICIIASKHHERAERHKATQSIDSAHLPSLIVCPPTLTGHWYHEILKFAPHLRAVQYVGSTFERATLRRSLSSYDVVISSYECVRSDISELSKFSFLYCVLDEGHIIKNTKTKLAVAVKQIKAQHRLLLSGTPIQNNVLELWSLFDFLMPGFLGNERTFNEKFSKPILADREGKATPKEREAAANALEALHKQVLPFLLRRLKEDVLNDLPPKIIQDYYCELSPVQQQLYEEFSRSKAAEEAGMEIETSASKEGQGHVFQSLQYLRKLCNHPALVLDGEPQRFKEIQKKIGGGPELHDLSHAPKMEALKQLLQDCGIGLPVDKLADDVTTHRVLIFCQLRPMLDIIEKDLFGTHMPTVSYMRLDGSTDPRKRHAIVQTFNADPRIDVLLLTTSVGGLGLNLTGADTVIFVDHDWNPMKDLQAMDRAHRLGQRKVVNVYRLITRGTLEEKIMGLQRFKLNIASSVVTQQNAGLGSMNTGEVLDLFKVSAEGEPVKTKSAGTGAVSMSKMLEELDELPPEDEYAELSLSNFLSKV